MIVLDTSVLSASFRRRRRGEAEELAAESLRRLILADQPLAVPAIVLQELLSGVRAQSGFTRLEDLLRGFPLLLATREDHFEAARIANACRKAGVSASAVDCLIAGQTVRSGGRLFSLDRDFWRMAPHCGLEVLEVLES